MSRGRPTLIAIAVASLSIAMAGCAAGPGALVGLVLAVGAVLGLAACAPGDDDDDCSGTVGPICEDGRTRQICCPANTTCNFGMFHDFCPVGTWVVRWERGCGGVVFEDVADTSPDTETTDTGCDGIWEDACREGRIVQLCCPTGLACNYGLLLVDCGGGACVEQPATCHE